MANAMVEDEEFKSSHQDLAAIVVAFNNQQNEKQQPQQHEQTNNSANMVHVENKPHEHEQVVVHPLRTKKSVEFLLQPEPKRPRPSARWTAKQVVDAISTSFTQQERLEAITKTKESLEHDVQAVHDDEIACGVDAALTKHLTFLTCHSKLISCKTSMVLTKHRGNMKVDVQNAGLAMKELVTTLESLEALFRASDSMVGASFKRMGPELLYLLTMVIDEEVDRRIGKLVSGASSAGTSQPQQDALGTSMSSHGSAQQPRALEQPPALGVAPPTTNIGGVDSSLGNSSGPNIPPGTTATTTTTTTTPHLVTTSDQPLVPAPSVVAVGTPEGDTLLRKALKLLGHFARVGDATKTIAHFPGLLPVLVNLVTLRPYECIPWEARLSALWVLANLACNAENMQMMVCTPGLVAAFVQVSCRPLHPGDSVELTMEVLRSRSIASRGILNLSWAPENKIILAEHAALIDLLAELAVHRAAPLHQTSRTVRQVLLSTRRHAVGALRNLAAAPRRTKISLCDYKKGHLLDILTDAALNDTDQNIKDRSLAAIHNLAIHDTAERMVNHPALVLALKDAWLSEEEEGACAVSHVDGTPKSHAQATILVLERSITPQMKAYENLRELLQVINPAPNSSTDDENEQGNMNNLPQQPPRTEDMEDSDISSIHATAV